MKPNEYILQFYQKLEVSLYYLKHTLYKEKIDLLADLIDNIKNKYKSDQAYNEYLINAQSRTPSNWFIAAEVWYRNACLDFEVATKQKIKNIFFPYSEFFL